MTKYQCRRPLCGRIYDSPVALSEPPICSGNHTRGKSHSAAPMKAIGEPTMPNGTTTKTKAAAKAAAKPAKAKAPDQECQCHAVPTETPGVYEGCGRLTGNEFAPGHDAKLKSALIYCAVNGLEYSRRVGSTLISSDPRTIAKERGWERFIDRAVAVATEKAAKAKAKADERTAKAQEAADAKAAKAKAKADAKAAAPAKAPAKKAAAKAPAKKAAAKA